MYSTQTLHWDRLDWITFKGLSMMLNVCLSGIFSILIVPSWQPMARYARSEKQTVDFSHISKLPCLFYIGLHSIYKAKLLARRLNLIFLFHVPLNSSSVDKKTSLPIQLSYRIYLTEDTSFYTYSPVGNGSRTRGYLVGYTNI